MLEIREPRRVVNCINVAQKYDMLTISTVVVPMQDRDRPVEQPIFG